ncbi:hypothetical protein BpHYR1_019725 [Brachionus plicatilis]|uniref:Uncharacterized protein n=1 Tax=Brachionus plicatilis TaxID=10195 RepID=A0A3M7PYK8_BRAPC|nr:hypothetical protein BpHYR1_019725 [Brachionus plicatilis]
MVLNEINMKIWLNYIIYRFYSSGFIKSLDVIHLLWSLFDSNFKFNIHLNLILNTYTGDLIKVFNEKLQFYKISKLAFLFTKALLLLLMSIISYN